MVVAIIQARFSSSRLPGKVLAEVLGKALLELQIERVQRAKCISHLVVATSKEAADDPIADLAARVGIPCHRGSLADVLDRVYQAALPFNPNYVARLTGDCPLLDPALIDQTYERLLEARADYACNTMPPTYPDGMDVEIMKFSALEAAWREARKDMEREHVTPFIYSNSSRFKVVSTQQSVNQSKIRLTVDTPEDLARVRQIFQALYPKKADFSLADIIQCIASDPALAKTQGFRNEGLMKSLHEGIDRRYAHSTEFLRRATKVIPLGSQTFSKSRTQFPVGAAPLYMTRGQGSRVWDIDGNEYIDFVNSLASVTLGYKDPDVTQAVREQLEDGVILSLPHPLETEVAELLVDMVPSAEMVRFGKNGSDATAGAVRLARAFTKRKRVAVCGYHGWQDWYIGSTARHFGVPEEVRALTHTFTYNNISSLDEILTAHPGEFAAVIMEPMNVAEPQGRFLEAVKASAHRHGALFILDETITGFRFANGGAQELFGVTPDLSTFGKGLANGYPLSAIVGRKDVMMLMEEVFFSFTFGGEMLSLAAAKATLNKLKREPVTKTLRDRGERLVAGVQERLVNHGITDLLSISGYPAWTFLTFKDMPKYNSFTMKTLFMQEMLLRGIFTMGSHNLSYAHTDSDIDRLFTVYDEVFPILRAAVDRDEVMNWLRCKPLEPLFKIR